MKTTIDADGRLVIPKKLRKQAGIEPGMPLELRYYDGRIEIEPAPAKVRLVRKGRFLVAVHDGPVEPLTTEMVEATRRAIQDERFAELMGSGSGPSSRREAPDAPKSRRRKV
ncbi:MAG TPA: AbrB/MazE/SpoVT family DNA-binding domain-containing protein [Chloroflexota bacterium]|jgi:AbrB family looped-hinge helix DNA binding protein